MPCKRAWAVWRNCPVLALLRRKLPSGSSHGQACRGASPPQALLRRPASTALTDKLARAHCTRHTPVLSTHQLGKGYRASRPPWFGSLPGKAWRARRPPPPAHKIGTGKNRPPDFVDALGPTPRPKSASPGQTVGGELACPLHALPLHISPSAATPRAPYHPANGLPVRCNAIRGRLKGRTPGNRGK